MGEIRVNRSRSVAHREFINIGDFCGCIPIRLCRPGEDESTLPTGLLEVRSVKLEFKKDYRTMLKSIANHSAALLLDSQAHTQQRLESMWDKDSPLMEQQLEFLRHCLDSPDFSSAIDQLLRFPHQRMERKQERRNISRAGKMDRGAISGACPSSELQKIKRLEQTTRKN